MSAAHRARPRKGGRAAKSDMANDSDLVGYSLDILVYP